MKNLFFALAVLSFTSCLGHPGGATRQKCPPKPPTIDQFNATEVGNDFKIDRTQNFILLLQYLAIWFCCKINLLYSNLGIWYVWYVYQLVLQYLGIWYEQRRFPAFFQLNTRWFLTLNLNSDPDSDPDPDPDSDSDPDFQNVLTHLLLAMTTELNLKFETLGRVL